MDTLPWPALVWILIKTGLSPVCAFYRPAINLNECAGTTLSSWSEVVTSVAGYETPDTSAWTGEYFRKYSNISGESSAVP